MTCRVEFLPIYVTLCKPFAFLPFVCHAGMKAFFLKSSFSFALRACEQRVALLGLSYWIRALLITSTLSPSSGNDSDAYSHPGLSTSICVLWKKCRWKINNKKKGMLQLYTLHVFAFLFLPFCDLTALCGKEQSRLKISFLSTWTAAF